MRTPTAIATASSSVNISGGSSKPRRNTWPIPGAPSIVISPRLQRGDITMDRPYRNFQFVGERSGGNRTRRRAQNPQDVEQTIGAAQGHDYLF